MDGTLPAAPAFEQLYGHHHRWLLAWLSRRLEDRADAADLAQDTFVRVLRAGEAGRVAEPRSYLSSIARGLLIDRYRRRSLERACLAVLGTLDEARLPSLEEQALMVESLLRIESMLDGLKPRVQETFLLSQLEGLTYPQIAERLGISVRSVSNYMTLALEHCFELAPWHAGR